MKIEIPRTSDEILRIKTSRKKGVFEFSEDNLTNVVCALYDDDGNQIGSYSISESTLVPVLVTEDASGNDQHIANNDTDIFIIYLLGTSTASSAIGRVRAKYTYTWTNTNFTNDNTKDTIRWVDTDYYIIANG